MTYTNGGKHCRSSKIKSSNPRKSCKVVFYAFTMQIKE